MGLHSIGGLDDFTRQRFLRAKAWFIVKLGDNVGDKEVLNQLLDLHSKHNLKENPGGKPK